MNTEIKKYLQKYQLENFSGIFEATDGSPFQKIEIKLGNNKKTTSLFYEAVKNDDKKAIDYFFKNYKVKNKINRSFAYNSYKDFDLLQELIINNQSEKFKNLLNYQKFKNEIKIKNNIEFINKQKNCRVRFFKYSYHALAMFCENNDLLDFLEKNYQYSINQYIDYEDWIESNQKVTDNIYPKIILALLGNNLIKRYENEINYKKPILFNDCFFYSDDLNNFIKKHQETMIKNNIDLKKIEEKIDKLKLLERLYTKISNYNRSLADLNDNVNINSIINNPKFINKHISIHQYIGLDLLTIAIIFKNENAIKIIQKKYNKKDFISSADLAANILYECGNNQQINETESFIDKIKISYDLAENKKQKKFKI